MFRTAQSRGTEQFHEEKSIGMGLPDGKRGTKTVDAQPSGLLAHRCCEDSLWSYMQSSELIRPIYKTLLILAQSASE